MAFFVRAACATFASIHRLHRSFMTRHFAAQLPDHLLDESEWVSATKAADDTLNALLDPATCSPSHLCLSGVSGGTMYTGLAGVAYALRERARAMKASTAGATRLLNSDAVPAPAVLMAAALRLCYEAQSEALAAPRKHVTFTTGRSGVLALTAALLHETGKTSEAQQAVQALEEMCASHVKPMAAGECELLYGRAGYLYSLLFVERCVGGVQRAILVDLVHDIVAAGVASAQSDPATEHFGLFYVWHRKPYLGAAHGLTGVLHTLLLAPREILEEVTVKQHAAGGGGGTVTVTALQLVRTAAHALVRGAFPSGNLPSSLDSDDDKLVHWCHGSPGLVPLLVRCHETFGGLDGGTASHQPDDYLQYARRAADDIWRRGLLTKGVGLCHGISGNAYAFLALYRATRDTLYLARAQRFGLFAAQHWRELYDRPDCPASLFEGVCGAQCLWAHLSEPSLAHFPGYELPVDDVSAGGAE